MSRSARAAAGLGKPAMWVVVGGGVVLLALIAAAAVIGIWLLVNAESALNWLNGVLAQIGPIVQSVQKLSGG